MKAKDAKKLDQGLYRVLWSAKAGGGESLAALGITAQGKRWLAPVNWITPSPEFNEWAEIERLERVDEAEFRKWLTACRPQVIELLQRGGYMPQQTEENAATQDWQSVLMEAVTSLFDECRNDESDPFVAKTIARRLARIGAVCEAWHQQLGVS